MTRYEWTPASEPPDSDRWVIVWCSQEHRAVHGWYQAVDNGWHNVGWHAHDAAVITHWRDVAPPTSQP